MKPRDLTPAESDAYDERLAHCMIDGGISEQRAHAIALEQVRPAKQRPLLGFERVTMEDVKRVLK